MEDAGSGGDEEREDGKWDVGGRILSFWSCWDVFELIQNQIAKTCLFRVRSFQFVSIVLFVENLLEKNAKVSCREHIVGDLTRLGPKPGKFSLWAYSSIFIKNNLGHEASEMAEPDPMSSASTQESHTARAGVKITVATPNFLK